MGMDKKETAEAIKVMQAYIDGERIDYKRRSDSKWFPLENFRPFWSWRTQEYRLTPKPREFILELNKDGTIRCTVEAGKEPWFDKAVHIKVREILYE